MTLPGFAVIAIALAYLAVLFVIAWAADRRGAAGRGLLSSPALGPWLYALSIAVYATSWTFYGSVGRASRDGIGFLPVYLGPTLAALLFPLLMSRIVRISKERHITSIADFISSSYGRSRSLAALVTLVAVIGVVPYIALQLKAVAGSFAALTLGPGRGGADVQVESIALLVALLLGAFAILFGARQLDASERHEGVVVAVAFESLFKLAAFVAVGVFTVWVLYDGWTDLFERAHAQPALAGLFEPFASGLISMTDWFWLTLLSGLAFLLLPRQFQVAVVENTRPEHVHHASWALPLYLLAINVFVLPIALAGAMTLKPAGIDADAWVLALPLSQGNAWLAVVAFLGGLSAATGMIIVETVALSTMVSNDLVLPWLIARRSKTPGRAARTGPRNLSRLLLQIRRASIAAVLLLGYGYYRLAGEAYPLVSIGLISFAAVAQFAPAFFGALWWGQGTRDGALAGIASGTALWVWCLFLPTFATAGWVPPSLLEAGPWQIGWLRPHALFGLTGLDPVVHGTVWSLLANAAVFVAVSVWQRAGAPLADASAGTAAVGGTRAAPPVAAVAQALARILGPARADAALAAFAASADGRGRLRDEAAAPPALLRFAEIRIAGAIGGASARIVMASLAPGPQQELSREALLGMIEETSQVLAHSRELEAANERLRELDRMKDDFVSTVSHELRTPLTSIRAFAEILRDNPELPPAKRQHFTGIVLKETERLTRLINQILDLAKIESGRAQWAAEPVDVAEVAADAVAATGELARERGVAIAVAGESTDPLPTIGDRDRLMQVMINLLSNAVKFCRAGEGRVDVRAWIEDGRVRVDVADNGVGIAAADQKLIFEKFRQAGDTLRDRPQGTGLGLPISRQIVRHLGGDLWVTSAPGRGATFSFSVPAAPHADRQQKGDEA